MGRSANIVRMVRLGKADHVVEHAKDGAQARPVGGVRAQSCGDRSKEMVCAHVGQANMMAEGFLSASAARVTEGTATKKTSSLASQHTGQMPPLIVHTLRSGTTSPCTNAGSSCGRTWLCTSRAKRRQNTAASGSAT